MRKCADCNATISICSNRCRKCSNRSRIGDRNPMYGRSGNKSPVYKGGKPRCKVCGKEICWKSTECQSCFLKRRKMSVNIKLCIDCGVSVSDSRYSRCIQCSNNKFKKGVPLKKDHKEKIIKNLKVRMGSSNNFWRGGISALQRLIRCSSASEIWRKSIFSRDNYTCRCCGVRGGYLEAHHNITFSEIFDSFIKEYSQFSPIEDKEILLRIALEYKPFWSVDNGISLCRDCHDKTKLGRERTHAFTRD